MRGGFAKTQTGYVTFVKFLHEKLRSKDAQKIEVWIVHKKIWKSAIITNFVPNADVET